MIVVEKFTCDKFCSRCGYLVRDVLGRVRVNCRAINVYFALDVAGCDNLVGNALQYCIVTDLVWSI